MKINYYYFIALLFAFSAKGQYSSSAFTHSSTYSSNGEFKIISHSYDDEFPTDRGFSQVFNISYSKDSLLYTIPRSFDLDENSKNFFLFISKDGKKIAYFSSTNYYNDKSTDKAVMIYENGQLHKKYSFEEFTDCDSKKEKCGLFFNTQQLIDYKKSNGSLLTLKQGTSDEDSYLIDNFIFNKNDSIYVIDARKKVIIYDLNNVSLAPIKRNFDDIYPQIKLLRKNKNSYITSIKSPNKYINDFESEINGEKLSETISKIHQLKFVPINTPEFYKYHLYKIEISGYLTKNGNFDIENFKIDDHLDKDKILHYIRQTKFKSDFLPKEVDQFYFNYFFGGYRNPDDKIAENITLKQKQKREDDFKKRLSFSEIDGIYIPKNMKECMSELDKTLNYESRLELENPKQYSDFNGHMGGLGMWIRNNWGINGGSRLLQYFKDRNLGNKRGENDSISGIIIYNYIQWLKGDKNIWKEWEKQNPTQLK